MVLRHLVNMLINNPHIIQKLSESYPVRRAAQMSVYMFLKGKRLKDEALDDILKNGSKKIGSFSQTFQQELKQGWKEASQELKKK